ncbi:unnamed protein product [Lepeophtheirus salmonis]|uniref:(salmon louse) hypothetical protein n=1 Tax=Lepeophtheirus salmonis TaxID=72036 RepID=A0A7R8CL36_LEPSM|nr:unnamed protein product [Lepeophtheirus salmonis]CAF2853792.1 unnamed protein product [Lepeophtheirus salmonis]
MNLSNIVILESPLQGTMNCIKALNGVRGVCPTSDSLDSFTNDYKEKNEIDLDVNGIKFRENSVLLFTFKKIDLVIT